MTLSELFQKKKHNILNVYCTAGFPELDSTGHIMLSLQQNGADIIEIGMPYSDPIADGPVIQQSNMVALHNGITIDQILIQLEANKEEIKVPVILMGYLNPVLQFGIQQFCKRAAQAGVSAVILPDLPLYEYESMYKPYFVENNLDFIFLVTPETTEERIRKIDAAGTGFIYVVSSSATTGNTNDINDQSPYFKKLQAMKLRLPLLVGFGIKDKNTFTAACEYSNGAIIGSAYIRALQNNPDIELATGNFLKEILN